MHESVNYLIYDSLSSSSIISLFKSQETRMCKLYVDKKLVKCHSTDREASSFRLHI